MAHSLLVPSARIGRSALLHLSGPQWTCKPAHVVVKPPRCEGKLAHVGAAAAARSGAPTSGPSSGGTSSSSSSNSNITSTNSNTCCGAHAHHLRSRLLRRGSGLLWGAQLQALVNSTAQAAQVYLEEEVELTYTTRSSRALITPGPVVSPPTYVTAPGRIVAIGDLHGDLAKAVRSFILARVLDFDANSRPVWIGGDTTVVQVGDVLDRGDCEIGIMELIRELGFQAVKEGGAVYMLNGNHESLNICGDFRYVTEGAFYETAHHSGLGQYEMRSLRNILQARADMYLPGGPMALELSMNPTVLVVNDTVFAHGGLLPSHVAYGLERMNEEMAAWMRRDILPDSQGGGFAGPPYLAMGDSKSVVWNRSQSRERFMTPLDRSIACSCVAEAIEGVGAKRLIVGHTPQMRGANCECDGQIWRIDVGMSSGVLNAPVSVLEIDKQQDGESHLQIITEPRGVLMSLNDDSEFDV